MTIPPLLAIPKFPRSVRPRKAKAPRPKEIALHMAVADVLRRFAKPDWRWSHFPAGELRDKRTAGKLKAMGLQPGWPDFIFLSPVAGQFYALELKRMGEDLTDEQKEFRKWCFDNLVPYAVAWSIDDAMAALGWFGVLRIKFAAGVREMAAFGEQAEAGTP
jgi:hypothetical protein